MALLYDLIALVTRTVIVVAFTLSVLVATLALAACDTEGSTAGGSAGATSAPGSNSVSGGGEALYTRYCQQCHPGGGAGIGPSLVLEAARMSDDQIKGTVRNGRGRMPSIGSGQLPDADLNTLVAYIRTLR